MFCRLLIFAEKCDIGKSIEMEVCLKPFCEQCTSSEIEHGCLEECAEVDNQKTCLCKESFTRDEFGNCIVKSNALRPFLWQCPNTSALLAISSLFLSVI